MRHKIQLLASILLLALLAACSTGEGNQAGTKAESNSKSTKFAPKIVLEKAESAFYSLESLSVDLKLVQFLSEEGTEKEIKLISDIHTDMITAPAAFHQQSEMKLSNTGKSYQSEAYYTEEGMFVYDGSKKEWAKYPPNLSLQSLTASKQQMNPAGELNGAEGIEKQLSLKENAKEFIVVLKAKGPENKKAIEAIVKKSLPADLQANGELLSTLSVDSLIYEIAINKDNFYPSRLKVRVEMQLKNKGNSLSMKQEMDGTYSNFNKLQEITVPESVKSQIGEAGPD